MNWLAHLVLSPPRPLVRLGNLAGDFVQGTTVGELHPELQRGIALHRAIDRFVDAHPVVRAGRERLRPPFRRFGAVLQDVYFDHFLARDFERLQGGPLPAFLAAVHDELRQHLALLPAPLQRVAPRLSDDGWLLGYAEIGGIERVLRLMAARLRRDNPLAQGVEPLRQHYDGWAADFAALWPQLRELVRGTPHETS